MSTERQNPVSASPAVLETRWPEGGRGRPRAAPESISTYALEEFTCAGAALAPEAIAIAPREPGAATRAARTTGGLAGSAVRFVQRVRTRASIHGEALEGVRRFVVRNPSALIGAGIAGFLTGRMLKRL